MCSFITTAITLRVEFFAESKHLFSFTKHHSVKLTGYVFTEQCSTVKYIYRSRKIAFCESVWNFVLELLNLDETNRFSKRLFTKKNKNFIFRFSYHGKIYIFIFHIDEIFGFLRH